MFFAKRKKKPNNIFCIRKYEMEKKLSKYNGNTKDEFFFFFLKIIIIDFVFTAHSWSSLFDVERVFLKPCTQPVHIVPFLATPATRLDKNAHHIWNIVRTHKNTLYYTKWLYIIYFIASNGRLFFPLWCETRFPTASAGSINQRMSNKRQTGGAKN